MRKQLAVLVASFGLISGGCEVNTPTLSPSSAGSPAAFSESLPTQDSGLVADQVLRVAISEPVSLDATTMGAPAILRALQRPLIDFNERGEIVPALAQKWDVTDGGKTLTFHLRDARYSNGDPIVAADMVYSARRLVDPRDAAGYAYVMARVVGGRALLAMFDANPQPSDDEIDAALQELGVEAPDDRTFVVHLENPGREFLSIMTLWFFVPLQEDWINSPNATEAGNFVSSGPFILDTWDHLSRIVLKPNPHWWGDVKPNLAEIQMTIKSQSDAQLDYEAGDLDLVITPTADIRRIKDDPVLGAEFHLAPQLAINFYSFNNFQDPTAPRFADPGPTANREFRIALTQAIDKQALIDTTWAGVGNAANSFIMPGIPGHQPDLNPYPYDLASAERHMATALDELGVASAAEVGPLKIGFIAGFDNEPRVAFLAEAWRRAFDLDFAQMATEQGVFYDDRSAGVFDIMFDGWGADYPDPGNQLDGIFTCGGGNNHRHYCNPEFDALVARAGVEPDPVQRVAIYQEAQTLLMNDAPILPLRYQVVAYQAKPYVVGLTDYPPGFLIPGDYYYETVQILDH
jgi:oligopeptide transport system substrate-binding protein